jgi:hypothetical protein
MVFNQCSYMLYIYIYPSLCYMYLSVKTLYAHGAVILLLIILM